VEARTTTADPAARPEGRDPARAAELTGLAEVAAVSFVAARAVPAQGFWVALAGGVAMARAGERHGPRRGYGASLAAMLESVAIMGPLRFGVPLTQAASAPLVGWLERRGASAGVQVLASALIRLLHTSATTAFLVWVLVGGVDAYGAAYDALAARVPLAPRGTEGALAVTGAGLLAWAAFASTVQVVVYRRGLERWPAEGSRPPAAAADPSDGERPRAFDPRAVAAAALLGFFVLLVRFEWAVLAVVALWLAVAWAGARGDRDRVVTGLLLAAVLGGGAFGATLLGGAGLGEAGRRALRAVLLVLVATWLRSAAGAPGLREVARRSLRRLRRVPAAAEARAVLDRLGAESRLLSAGRSLAAALAAAPRRPLAVLDAVLRWVAERSAAAAPRTPPEPLELRLRPRDVLLPALLAAAVAATLLAG
jgi:hypothetical protein